MSALARPVFAAPAAAPSVPALEGESPKFSDYDLARLEAQAPLLRGDRLVAAWPTPTGGGVAVGHHQLYEFEQGEWTAIAYSRAAPRKTSVNKALSVDGTLYLIGDRGLLLRRRDARNFDRVVLDGLDPRTRGLDWLDAWATPVGNRLYIRAGYDRLLQIELGSGHTRLFHLPRQGSGSGAPAATAPIIVGRGGAGQEEVLLVMGRGMYIFDGREVKPLASFDADISEIGFSGPDRARAKVGDSIVDLPLDQVGAGEVHELEALSAHDERVLAAERRRAKYRRKQDAMLAADTFWFPTLRVAPGAQFQLGDLEDRFGEDGPRVVRTLELGVGVLLAPPTGDKYKRGHALKPAEAWFWPEIGYTWSPSRPDFEHAAFVGLGFGVGNDFIAGYYKPRAVLGFASHPHIGAPMPMDPDDADLGAGGKLFPALRHGLSAQAVWGLLGAEISHGMVFGDEVRHDLRLSLDINLMPLIWAAILLRPL